MRNSMATKPMHVFYLQHQVEWNFNKDILNIEDDHLSLNIWFHGSSVAQNDNQLKGLIISK